MKRVQRLEEELAALRTQQAATGKILKVISQSGFDLTRRAHPAYPGGHRPLRCGAGRHLAKSGTTGCISARMSAMRKLGWRRS